MTLFYNTATPLKSPATRQKQSKIKLYRNLVCFKCSMKRVQFTLYPCWKRYNLKAILINKYVLSCEVVSI